MPLIENIPDNYPEPVFVIKIIESTGFEISGVNDTFCRLVNYNKDELLGQNPVVLFSKDTESLTEKHFIQTMHKKMLKWESVLAEKSGNRIPVEVRSIRMDDVMLVLVKDLTRNKATYNELKNHQTLLRRTESTAKIGYWELDVKNKKIWGSKGARMIYGLNDKNFTFQEITKMPLEIHRPKLDQMMKDLIEKGEKYDVEFEILTGSNKVVYLRSIAEYDFFEKKVYGIIQDITENKKVEQELIAAKNKAEESDRLKSAFLSNMSHEIRTPMNGIMGFSQLLAGKDLSDEEKSQFVDIIAKSCDKLLETINDILDISKIETGQVSVRKTEVNIYDLIDSMGRRYREAVHKKGLEMYIRNVSDKSLCLNTDNVKLHQIIENLLNNALKFTPTGFIELGCEISNGYAHFFVKDSGIGIAPEHHSIIFEPFRQAEISTSVEYGGFGIGLSITKNYVKILGGEIKIESQLGLGTRFDFTFPISQSSEIIKNQKEQKPMKSLLCMIVEDFEINYLYLKALLTPLGINVVWAKNGHEALKMVIEKSEIDFILMDIRLPDLSGYELTKMIKKSHPLLPIIVQTANAMVNEKEEAFMAGCDDYITKPIYKDVLLQKIATFVKN
jgi:PAS domain S-box-containing protein